MATENIDAEIEPGLSGMDLVKCFNSELNSMCETKPPVSKAKMISVTKSAMKAHRMYKHVVHCVEKFIQKCRPEYKVPGLYVMDSIVRQARHQFPNEKEVFAPRFSKNIQTTFKNLLKCREAEIPKLVRVLNLWQKNGIYSPSVIQPLLAMVAPRPGTRSSLSRTASSQDPSLNAAEVVAANAVAIIQQQQTHIQALLQQQAQQQLANLSPNLLQNIQSLQSLLSNANIVTPVTAAPAITSNSALSIPLSSTLEKLKEAASSVLGLTGSTASGTAHSSSMADMEPAQEFKPKLKPHQLQHINQFLEQQETAQNHEYINEVNRPPPPPPPPPPVPASDIQQRRMERNLREFEREHKISQRRFPHEAWHEKRGRQLEGRVHELERHVQISDDEEGGVDMEVGTPSPPMFEDTTRSFLDDFDYGDDQGEEERIEEQKRRVSQERNKVAKLSERNRNHFPPSHPPPDGPTQLPIPARPTSHAPHPKQQHEEKVGDSIPTISRIQLGPSRISPEKSQPPFLKSVVPINSSPHQPLPPVRLPWMDPSLRPPPTLPLHQFPRPLLSSLPPGIPPQHIFPPPFIPPQQHRHTFPLPPPPVPARPQFRPHSEFPTGPIIRPPPPRHINPQDMYPPESHYPRERDSYPPVPIADSPLRENSDSPRGAFSRWRHSPSPPPEARERDKKRQKFRREAKEVSYDYEERRRYRSRSRSPDRDKERRARKRQKSSSPVERKERSKRRDKSRSPRDKRKRRELEVKEKDRFRVGREGEGRSATNFHQSPTPKWKALEQVGQEHGSKQKEQEGEKTAEISKREKEKKKHSFSLAKNKCISVLSTTIWVQIKKVAPNIERVIREKCEEFGPVLSFDLIPSRGCAYVDMETRESADMLVNEEREIKLGGVTSKFVYAPGKGVKEDSFKPHWDATHGITYLPWSIISDEEFDLSEFQEGGILDPDTFPPGVEVPEKRVVPDSNLPTATIFMPLPPMIPPFPPNLPPSSASIIPTSQPTFPPGPPMGILPLPAPDSQPPPPLLTQPVGSEARQIPPLASDQLDPPITTSSLFPPAPVSAPPAEFNFNGEDTHLSGANPFLPPFRPPPASSVRPDQEAGADRFRHLAPHPEPFFRPHPPIRVPLSPRPQDIQFRPPPFPNMRPHPDNRFRIPPPLPAPMRAAFPSPYEFRYPPPRAHRPPGLRHEFRVPALPAEYRHHHHTDSVNNTEKPSTHTFARPSTPPGYSKGSPQKEAPGEQPDPSQDQNTSRTPLCPETAPSLHADSSQGSEDTPAESEQPPESAGRPNKPLVAEYSDVYSPHSEDGSGETTELRVSAQESVHTSPSPPSQI